MINLIEIIYFLDLLVSLRREYMTADLKLYRAILLVYIHRYKEEIGDDDWEWTEFDYIYSEKTDEDLQRNLQQLHRILKLKYGHLL